MTETNQQASKEEVQSTRLNQLPVEGENDTEFSAEEAADVFANQPSSERKSE